MAKSIVKHSQDVFKTDENTKDKLWDIKIQFDEENDKIEASFRKALADLRQSPDEMYLEDQFMFCKKTLQDIEKLYRTYCENGKVVYNLLMRKTKFFVYRSLYFDRASNFDQSNGKFV